MGMLFLRLVLLIGCLLLPVAVWAESLPPMVGANGQPYPVPMMSPYDPYETDAGVSTMPVAPVSADYFELQRKKIMRWNDQTRYIMVYIADGSYLPGWNPENIRRVKAALTEWEQAMAPRFHFIYMPDERGTDVTITWQTRMGSSEKGETMGTTSLSTWGKYIAKNNIRMALLSPDGRTLSPAVIQSVALHEAGHMLGLLAHSDSPNDVMYPTQDFFMFAEPRHLTARDINTLKRVYDVKPDYANPEGYHLSDFKSFQKTQRGHRLTLLWVPVPGVPFPVPVPLPF